MKRLICLLFGHKGEWEVFDKPLIYSSDGLDMKIKLTSCRTCERCGDGEIDWVIL